MKLALDIVTCIYVFKELKSEQDVENKCISNIFPCINSKKKYGVLHFFYCAFANLIESLIFCF